MVCYKTPVGYVQPVTDTPSPVLLAEGCLGWDKYERQSGRYGAVLINTDSGPSDFAGVPVGVHGRLIAEVVQARRSFHVGDWNRGVGPTTPAAGERIVLGEGPLFVDTEIEEMDPHIGVGDPDEWDGYPMLDVEALYRAHGQDVRLWLEPIDVPASESARDREHAEIDG